LTPASSYHEGRVDLGSAAQGGAPDAAVAAQNAHDGEAAMDTAEPESTALPAQSGHPE
jgi:hypothetical protein